MIDLWPYAIGFVGGAGAMAVAVHLTMRDRRAVDQMVSHIRARTAAEQQRALIGQRIASLDDLPAQPGAIARYHEYTTGKQNFITDPVKAEEAYLQ